MSSDAGKLSHGMQINIKYQIFFSRYRQTLWPKHYIEIILSYIATEIWTDDISSYMKTISYMILNVYL